jgi:hypothetical protein
MGTLRKLYRPLAAGLLSGAVSLFLTNLFHLGAADFAWRLGAARELLAGRDPYAYTPGPYAIPYPLPADFFGLPFAALPDGIAGALFMAFSVALLVWGFQRAGEPWRMGMLFSWPFLYSLIFVQWAPLFCALWFFPVLSALILVKPNIALPLVLSGKISKPGAAIAAATLAISLLVYPTWPLVWLKSLGAYQGIKPPIAVLPFGPLILAALLRWRSRQSWLLLTMAIMPQRMFYDQLPLLLVAESPKQLFLLIACSWCGFLALWLSDGMAAIPGGWQLWIILCNYLPAVAVVLADSPIISALRYRLPWRPPLACSQPEQ